MAQPYVGEIRMFAGNFAPSEWAFCDGQLLSIAENETLFQLIGTTYGGDGQTTFAVPDLRGRVPVHQGSGYVVGQLGGVEQVTLTASQIPSHTHVLRATTAAAQATAGPSGSLLATATTPLYASLQPPLPQLPPPPTAMAPTVASAGGSQPHDNLAPSLCVNFIISLLGIFPSPS